jgi:hypothetical protein
MSEQKKPRTLRIRTHVKAGGPEFQHGVRVRTGVKAGNDGTNFNHGLRIRRAS